MVFRPLTIAMLAAAAAVAEPSSAPASADVASIRPDPGAIRLDGPTARQSILVEGRTADGESIDLTRSARFRSLDETVATVTASGVVEPVRDGRAAVVVEAAGASRTVEVTVEGFARPRTFNFENDVVPVLSKLGCNASGCHGKAEGQNGFKLSVFGFDPESDHAALTREGRGRRVFPAAPERSLLLTKMTGESPHGGGVRAARDGDDYRTLRDWIAAGMPFGREGDPKIAGLRVEPRERRLAMKGTQQLRVTAQYTDGREADVTSFARFQSNNDGLATVDAEGLVRAGESPGDVAVMASYMGTVDVFRALIPRPGRPGGGRPDDSAPATRSGMSDPERIDALVLAKLRKLNVEPSDRCTDAEFLRRASLDVVGTLPTAAEARRFLADDRPDRRARLVDELLARPEYADFWALKWADLLRVDREALGHKRAFAYYRWLRDEVAADAPLDELARRVVTAEGPLDEPGPASFYKVISRPGDAAGALAQVFLGVRIACAECHHHPFDRWGQDDYYGMQAYFAPLGVRPGPRGEALLARGEPKAVNPRTGATLTPRPLGGEPTPALGDGAADPRAALADWFTAPENPYFARNLANRFWAHFLGRGIVEPVDDVRATNPPANPELLDELARILVDGRFDARAFIRTIAATETYQRSSRPNATNADDEQNYSRARLRRLGAEVLLDMICQATGVPEKFPGTPPGVRAIQLWDSKVGHDFLRRFGRPERVTTCACERNAEPSVGQVLHLLNSPRVQDKLTHEAGAVADLARRCDDDASLVDELYLGHLSRFPTPEEREAALGHLARPAGRRREAAEDLAWSLLNSLEFLFNH